MAADAILLVLSAPSGCGKSTVLRRLMEMRENLRFSVSATTRAPRTGERDGADYFFVSRERFQEMIRENAFLEYAEYVGNCYGTPAGAVDERLRDGCDVLLDIDVQGAMQVKKRRPEAFLVFLMPPSMEELERRLVSRGLDEDAAIRRRLAEAERECARRDAYDIVVVNDDVERAAAEISMEMDRYRKRNRDGDGSAPGPNRTESDRMR